MRDADKTGPIGKAWLSESDRPTTNVATWILHLPGSPREWWMLTVATLADLDGVPSAVKQYEGAEFELMIMALRQGALPDPDDYKTWKPTHPPSAVVQFDGCSSAQAKDLAGKSANACVHGVLSPDDGWSRLWVQAVSAHLAMVAHQNAQN